MFRLRTCFNLLLFASALTLHRAVAQTSTTETVTASTAPTPHGVDVAGMDRSVKPGDDFFEYANGTWLKTDRDPRRSQLVRGGRRSSRMSTDRRVADLIQADGEGRRRPAAPTSGRSATTTPASWTRRPSTPPASSRSSRRSIPSPPSRTARTWRTCSARRSAPTWMSLNNTNFYTENLFGLWVAQDLDDPTQYSPVPAPGRAGHARPELLPRLLLDHGDDPRQVPGARRGDARPGRNRRQRDARPRPSRDSRPGSRQAHWSREASGDVEQGEQPLGARGLRRPRRPDSTGTTYSRRRRPRRRQPRFVVWQPSAVTGISALDGERAARHLEGRT